MVYVVLALRPLDTARTLTVQLGSPIMSSKDVYEARLPLKREKNAVPNFQWGGWGWGPGQCGGQASEQKCDVLYAREDMEEWAKKWQESRRARSRRW
jgi:hypothetical protein